MKPIILALSSTAILLQHVDAATVHYGDFASNYDFIAGGINFDATFGSGGSSFINSALDKA